jgi:hypothetical protein
VTAAHVRFTSTDDGDLGIDLPAVILDPRRSAIAPGPWTWLRQEHGARVVTVTEPGEHAGASADAAVTSRPGVPLAVHTADCGPIALLGRGAVGVVHAGWRGLAAGVVPAAVAALRHLDPGPIRAVIGPCIRTRCYEFGPADLDAVAAACGDVVRGTTAWGTPGLDLVAGITAALSAAGVHDVDDTGTCTACSPRHWSYRARGDHGRQAVVAWVEP